MDIGGTKGLGFGCTLESYIHSFQRFTRLCKNDEQCEEHEEPQHGRERREGSNLGEWNPILEEREKCFGAHTFEKDPLFGY